MPDDYPDYPDHRRLLSYIRAYADEFPMIRSWHVTRRCSVPSGCADSGGPAVASGADNDRAAGVGASIPRLEAKSPSDVRGKDVVNHQHHLTGFHQLALWVEVNWLYAFE